MLQPQRHDEILRTLEHQGGVKVADLASRLEVTEETIRRDLVKMESEGRLIRTHGGALPALSPRDALPYQHRELEQVDAKRRIARTAVREIEEEDVLFLDASTTCYHLARIFPDIRCTVLTHSEPVFRELSHRTNVELVSTGGLYDRRTSCFVGPLAEQMLSSLHLTTAFLGCKGLDFKRGYSDGSVRHMNLKRSVIKGADQVVVLADHTKLDSSARYFFASLEDVDLIITDPAVSADHREQMKRASIRVRTESGTARP